MERITSRQNQLIRRFRALCGDAAARREAGEFVCDGEKLLDEALSAGAELTALLWDETRPARAVGEVPAFQLPRELLAYVSPLENSPGPVFTVRRRQTSAALRPRRVLVLEDLQDPGNVGTILRSAAALCTELVVLTGACADPYSPKAVRASMGAVFRQPVLECPLAALPQHLADWGLPLYGAALSPLAEDVRRVPLTRAAVAVGNEGRGLSPALLALCDKTLIIPMAPGSESLNAAVAAAILMWQLRLAAPEEL